MDLINLQIVRESFGRVVYTHKTHEKAAEIESENARRVKWANVILTALTSTSVVADLLSNYSILQYASSILAAVTLGFIIFQLSFAPDEKAEKHRQVAKELWFVRERYVNLLADIKNGSIETSEIIMKRDRLTHELGIIYKFAPQTNSKAYKKAQKALKINEDLTFSDEEINHFLPKELHVTTRHASAD